MPDIIEENKQMLDLVSYNIALNKVLKIHVDRRKKYGDSWVNDKEYQIMGLVKEKVDRLEMNFLNPSKNYESKEDTLIDLINWSLFYLQLIKKYEQAK